MEELSPIHRHPDTDSEDDWDLSLSGSEFDQWDIDENELQFSIDEEDFGNTFYSMNSTVPLNFSGLEVI